MAKQRLGTNLNALLGSARLPVSLSDDLSGPSPVQASLDGTMKDLPVEFLLRGKYQPRRDMHPDALEELAESIKEQGIMQPIVVRPAGQNRYEIIAGERRWRAAQLAGLAEVPALIRDVPDEAAIAMALIENIQREDLNPIEEAIALSRLQKEFELTQQEVAQAVGKSRAAVANILRLMALNPEVKKMLEYGDLEMGHARALLSWPKRISWRSPGPLRQKGCLCVRRKRWSVESSRKRRAVVKSLSALTLISSSLRMSCLKRSGPG